MRYGAYAMEVLINELIKSGGRRERFEAKVFGGAAVLAGMTTINIGDRNAEFVRRYLGARKDPHRRRGFAGRASAQGGVHAATRARPW